MSILSEQITTPLDGTLFDMGTFKCDVNEHKMFIPQDMDVRYYGDMDRPWLYWGIDWEMFKYRWADPNAASKYLYSCLYKFFDIQYLKYTPWKEIYKGWCIMLLDKQIDVTKPSLAISFTTNIPGAYLDNWPSVEEYLTTL